MFVPHAHEPAPFVAVDRKAVPVVGETSHGSEGSFLALASDDDRRVGSLRTLRFVAGILDREIGAFEGRLLVLQHAHDDLHTLVETVEPLSEIVAQRDAVGACFEFVPPRPQAKLQATVRDDVGGGCHVRRDRRVPVWHPVDHRPHLDPIGGLGEGRERSPALEAGTIGVAEDRIEVVEHPGGVEQLDLVGPLPACQHPVPGGVMWVGLDSVLHAHPLEGCPIMAPAAVGSPAR